jgi:hypothetical protein
MKSAGRDHMPQALLIVDELQADKVLSHVAEMARVTQRLPPRLAIVEGDPDRLAAIHGIPGIIAMFEGRVTETMLQQLNPTERLFAEAWTESRRPKPDRVGEGLSWDAEGFEPPDARE